MEIDEMNKIVFNFGFVYYGYFDHLKWSKYQKIDHSNSPKDTTKQYQYISFFRSSKRKK